MRRVRRRLDAAGPASFAPPLLIGGMAMARCGMRPAGADIDLVIVEADCQRLAAAHPEKRKDIWGDLGLVIGEFENWRSIALMDYDFLCKDAQEADGLRVVSLERLLLMRVLAMDVEKYRRDLERIRNHYRVAFRNPAFAREAEAHERDYLARGGIVYGGRYEEEE